MLYCCVIIVVLFHSPPPHLSSDAGEFCAELTMITYSKMKRSTLTLFGMTLRLVRGHCFDDEVHFSGVEAVVVVDVSERLLLAVSIELLPLSIELIDFRTQE